MPRCSVAGIGHRGTPRRTIRLEATPSWGLGLHASIVISACLSRVMRRLKHIAIGTSAFLAFLAIAVWPSPPPVKLRLVEVSPSGTIDDDGTQGWLATLSVSNSSSFVLTLPKESIGVEAKVSNRWVKGRACRMSWKSGRSLIGKS
jgi:hypothetical protein